MKFLLYLPHAGRSGPARMGRYSRNHEHGGKLLFKGQPLEVDPFDPVSVKAFNETVRKEIEVGYHLGLKVYPLPPRLELLVLEEPAAPEPVTETPDEKKVEDEKPAPPPRKAGRPAAVNFPPHPAELAMT